MTTPGPIKLSRSKLELFLDCPRCFYLVERHRVKRPEFPAFTLNSAVDHLLKKEFDGHRARGTAHPLMKTYGLRAVPFAHSQLSTWRHNFTGIQFLHQPTGFLVYGAIDDIWKSDSGELHVVDYKATSKDEAPTLEGRWQAAFKRQMEVYQWLFRQNGFPISPVGYFVYANGRRDREAFDGQLEFDVQVIPYQGRTDWIEPALLAARRALDSAAPPPAAAACEYCRYRAAAAAAEKP